MRHWLSGNYVHTIKALHDLYGPVVQTAPNQLTFCSASSWKDIYGHSPSREAFLKGSFYEPLPGEAHNIVSVSDPECKDEKIASQPFLLGSRGCLGRR